MIYLKEIYFNLIYERCNYWHQCQVCHKELLKINSQLFHQISYHYSHQSHCTSYNHRVLFTTDYHHNWWMVQARSTRNFPLLWVTKQEMRLYKGIRLDTRNFGRKHGWCFTTCTVNGQIIIFNCLVSKSCGTPWFIS